MINFFHKHATLIILFTIFLIGMFLRFYQLERIPSGFHIDEAINGVNGYFILHTGRDSNNNLLPFQTEVFGDYNPTGYAYLTILPIKLFGLNEYSTRFPGAMLGSLSILAFFLLSFSIFRNKSIAALSAFLVAISPWHIVFSRSSEQTLIAVFFVILGFALVILSYQNNRLRLLIPGVTLLMLSFFMYFTPRVFIPLLLGFIIFLYKIWKKNVEYRNFFLGSFLLLAIAVLLLIFGATGGTNRFNQVSIFGAIGTKLIMEEQIREDGVAGTNVKITQVFHNKVVNYSLTFISNYLDYFSGNFLFIKGGLPVWLKVEGVGPVYLLELPFFLIGLVLLIINKKMIYRIPVFWLIIAPLASAITTDDIPNMRRSLLMFPMIELISAFGFFNILQNMKKPLKIFIITIFILMFTFNFLYFLHQYYIHSGLHRNWYRNEGFDEMVKTVKDSYDKVDKVIVTKSNGGIYPLILFYMKYDPKLYLSEGLLKDKDYTGFGKFFFVPQACPFSEKDDRFPRARKIIYINKGECKYNVANQKNIYRKDGTQVFNIVYENFENLY